MLRRALSGSLACLALTACETPRVLPTQAEGPPPFSRITWDWTTLSPRPGTAFEVGQTLTYRAEAFYEFAPEDVGDGPLVARLDLETRWRSQYGTWFDAGDMIRRIVRLEDGATSGTIDISGSLVVPGVSPECQEYEELSLYARIGHEDVADTIESEKSGASMELRLPYAVSGTEDTGAPCVEYRPASEDHAWAWGELIEAVVHNTTDAQAFTYALGDDPQRGFLLAPELYYSTTITTASTFLPVGSGGGPLRVFVDGVPAVAGGGLWTRYDIPEPRDFGDPDNDRWNDPAEDQLFLWGTPIAFYGPELAFTALDREPAPDLNPWGWDEYGRGDWWSIFIHSDHIRTLCVLIQHPTGSRDEADLFITTSLGELLPAERTPGADWQWLVMPMPSGPHTFYIWAAPKVIDSKYGRYYLTAGDCSWFGSPARERLGGSRTSRDPPLPPGVSR